MPSPFVLKPEPAKIRYGSEHKPFVEQVTGELSVMTLKELATQLLARRKVPSLPLAETELLQQINQGLPAAAQHRYNELRTKLQAQTISPAEHQELLAVIDNIEQADAERL